MSTHAIIPTAKLAAHSKLVSEHARLIGATLALLRTAERYGVDDRKHLLAIAEVREALSLSLDDLVPLLAASVERNDRPADVVCSCSCGRGYTREQWGELEYVGQQLDGEGGMLELRQCARCGSTRAVEVPNG